jgi:transposase
VRRLITNEEAPMPAPRISMRKIHEVLRLKYEARLTNRQIAQCTKLAHSTIGDYLRRAQSAGLTWPLPDDLTQDELERVLFPVASAALTSPRPAPEWIEVHRELRRKGVTLLLLWQEYKAACPEGYQYSRFCEHYRAWHSKVDVVMRQSHKAGEKLFVDYAGQTIPVVDPSTGEEREAQIFVAVLGASNYSYAEATWTQELRAWIGAHVRCFRYFGGVPEIVVPDNTRSAISKAHRYEPDINPTYADMAAHYGVAVIPARQRAPRDKAKVEKGVQVVEQWILARLRNRRFFSLAELNEAIAELLEELNDRPFQKLPGSRRTAFEEFDQPALRPLPRTPYVFAEWKKARAGIDYHVEVDGHYYSVPYQHARASVDLRITETTIECFVRGRRIASHVRSFRPGRHTTVREHMPKSHQQYAEWTPERILRWAAKTGPATEELARRIIASRTHPQQGYRSCLGVLRLGKAFGETRLEAACRRAVALNMTSYKSVESILKQGLDQQPVPPDNPEHEPPIAHNNIRGALYYNDLFGGSYEC